MMINNKRKDWFLKGPNSWEANRLMARGNVFLQNVGNLIFEMSQLFET